MQEASAKIEFFRNLSIKNDIIFVPCGIAKSSVVDAGGNILIDDSIKNLEDWKRNGGIPLYYGDKESVFYRATSIEDAINEQRINRIINIPQYDEER